MGFQDVTSADAVSQAIREFDELGREAFLQKYGFGRARRYFVKVGDRFYDSKAIIGVAHKLQYPLAGPLRQEDFSGGEATVKAKLEDLGFEVVDDAQEPETIHLVVKWSARYGADTVNLHLDVAREKGAVWCGLYSADTGWRMSEEWMARLQAQIASGVDTFVFLSGPTCWRTRLQGVEYERSATEQEFIPDYYEKVDRYYHLWVKLAEFEPVERDWLMRMLEPVRNPGKLVVLGNQTNPLIVHVRTRPRFWWVNQGQSYLRAREGGYIWAPALDKRGSELPHWRTMRYLKENDLVLHYANTQIRARGRVLGLAEPHGRPFEEADQAWSDAGYLARIEYRDVDPISLAGIPEAWRMKEGGPFTSAGRVQQGFLYPVSDDFVAKLAGRFTQLPIDVDAAVDAVAAVNEAAPFDLEAVRSAAVDRGLILDDTTYAALLAVLESGKHVILTGPPGTAKTTLAEVIAEVAAGAGRCSGYVLTTATADWTTYETIGGLKPNAQTGLAFAEGHFLEAIEKNQWLARGFHRRVAWVAC